MSQDTGSSLSPSVVTSEQELEEATERLIRKFDLGIDIEVEIAKRFKQKAGQYRHGERKIRISQHLIDNHPRKIIETVKHEIGHAVAMHRYGKRRIKPHGKEWKSIMQEMEVDKPEACHNLQLTEYSYVVRCTNPNCDVELGRHKKSRLVKKPEFYVCKECGSNFESFEVRKIE